MTFQNRRLSLKRLFWQIRGVLLAKQDSLPHLKLESGLYSNKKHTIVYPDSLLAETEDTQRAWLWHNIGLWLIQWYEPETPVEHAAQLAADHCLDERKRVRRFLRALGIGPAHEQGRPSDAAKCRDAGQEGVGQSGSLPTTGGAA